MSWLQDLFGVQKPIIAMCHLHALPGDPAVRSPKGVVPFPEFRGPDVHLWLAMKGHSYLEHTH